MTSGILVILAGLVALILWLYTRWENARPQREARNTAEADRIRLESEFTEKNFDRLERYNYECDGGITHDEAYIRWMAQLQVIYKQWCLTNGVDMPTPDTVRQLHP